MEVNIIDLATQCPDITISIKASDLLTAGRTLKDEILEELRANQLIAVEDGGRDHIPLIGVEIFDDTGGGVAAVLNDSGEIFPV